MLDRISFDTTLTLLTGLAFVVCWHLLLHIISNVHVTGSTANTSVINLAHLLNDDLAV